MVPHAKKPTAAAKDVAAWLKKIGARIAKLREQQHRNQAGVAIEAGISKDALSNMENGSRGFQMDRLLKVLLVLKQNPWTFFGGSEATRPRRRIDLQLLHDKLDEILDAGGDDATNAAWNIERWHKALPQKKP